MKCAQCGAGVEPGALYCSKCGVSTQAAGGYGVSAASQTTLAAAGPAAGAVSVFAGFWRRFAAYFLDVIIIYAVAAALGFGLIAAGALGAESAMLINVLFIALIWLYFALQESSDAQATLGKRAVAIKVVDEQGERIGFGRATGRHFAKIVSGLVLLIGYVMAAFTQRKQGLHDFMAGTLVVRRNADAAAMERGYVEDVGGGAGVVIAIVAAVGGVFIVGILAAIAIPAYHDYTIRAQVSEGFIASAPLKAAIAEWSLEHERWPIDAEEMELDDEFSGKYVERLDVHNGAIVITFGNAANVAIRGGSVVLAPHVDASGAIEWRCGANADGVEAQTTIKPKHLPASCRNQ